jgi:Cu2+-exporting ATPase
MLKIMVTSSWNWVQFALSGRFYATWMFFTLRRGRCITWNLNMFTSDRNWFAVASISLFGFFPTSFFQMDSKQKAERAYILKQQR